MVARDDVARAPAAREPEDEPEPDPDDQIVDQGSAGPADPESAAMALLKEQLGAQVIDD